jgi:hypothetical protein
VRAAELNELKTHALPVLTARISERELEKWFPVSFQHIDDPQEAPEPSKAALIDLDAGDYFVLYYGEISNQLTLRIPESTDGSAFLSALLREVPLPRAPHHLAPRGCPVAATHCRIPADGASPQELARFRSTIRP